MKIAAINNFYSRPSFGTENSIQDDYVETQTKQALRDSFETIKNEATEKVSQVIEGKYQDEFVRKIEESKKTVSKNDIISIFTELREAYLEAGMEKDASILGDRIVKLLKTK